ncbi:hypothetical protein, partial [Porphyromonas gingivalis]|uniref:hypothetical protein n=1 Tax=Porphyromonas gingivalis TaxID=837 RepID=UPI001C53B342
SPLLSRTIEEHIQKVIQCPAKDKRPQKTFPNTIIRFLMRLPWADASSSRPKIPTFGAVVKT